MSELATAGSLALHGAAPWLRKNKLRVNRTSKRCRSHKRRGAGSRQAGTSRCCDITRAVAAAAGASGRAVLTMKWGGGRGDGGGRQRGQPPSSRGIAGRCGDTCLCLKRGRRGGRRAPICAGGGGGQAVEKGGRENEGCPCWYSGGGGRAGRRSALPWRWRRSCGRCRLLQRGQRAALLGGPSSKRAGGLTSRALVLARADVLGQGVEGRRLCGVIRRQHALGLVHQLVRNLCQV